MELSPLNQWKEQERRLWLLAFAIASALIAILLWIVGLLMIPNHHMSLVAPLPAPQDAMIIALAPTIPPTSKPAPATPEAAKNAPRFARTSPDQSSAAPEKADFIGERDTIATSDAMPVAGAPALPSQQGREPLRPNEIETTESRPQDGALEHEQIATPSKASSAATALASSPTDAAPSPPTPAANMKPSEAPPKPQAENQPSPTRPETATLPGTEAVDRPIAEESPKSPQPKKTLESANAKTEQTSLPKPTPPTAKNEPGFRGNQSKTKITGSIKRQGRSALNVANTPMGRYHSAISRAVEAAWHRNCIKYRDFITPGVLTIRFVIDPNSTIRSVTVVEMIDAGEVQKGFTLHAIRQANIPPIPTDLKKELQDEPIEITYNFYF